MTIMSDLPMDLEENILSRVPLTSMRRVRFTCQRWNGLSKDPRFAKKHFGKAARHFIVMSDFRVWLMSLNGEEDDLVGRYMERIGKLTSLNNSEQVEISKVFQCNGLLLCVTKDKTRLVVWNPYLGQTRWIEPRNDFNRLDRYALGYDKNNMNQKILRILDYHQIVEYEIYDFKSSSWRVLDVTPDSLIASYQLGVSLEGNTYLLAQEKIVSPGENGKILFEQIEDFLICFDFTIERFGPRLPLPFHSNYNETLSLCNVREEQLAVLYQRDTSCELEIWVTNKIVPEEVSWSKLFLAADMRLLTGLEHFQFALNAVSFFIDEEKKIAVVFNKDKDKMINDTVYMIGENGYYKEVDLGYLIGYHKQIEPDNETYTYPLVCSYFPSFLKIHQGEQGKRKIRDY